MVEYAEEGTLSRYITDHFKRGRDGDCDAAGSAEWLAVGRKFLAEMLLALEFLHDLGDGKRIICRDVKPDNVLVFHDQAAQPHVKLTDFGGAKETSLGSAAMSIKGTPPFVAPEMYRKRAGEGPLYEIGWGVDIFALGVTFFTIMYGTEQGETAYDALVALYAPVRPQQKQVLPPQENDPPTDPPTRRRANFLVVLHRLGETKRCPPAVCEFIRRTTEYVPEDRWQAKTLKTEAALFRELQLNPSDPLTPGETLPVIAWAQLLGVKFKI